MSRSISFSEFQERMTKIHKDTLSLISEYKNLHTRSKFKCNVCNNEWDTTPNHIVSSSKPTGCPVCKLKAGGKRRCHTLQSFTDKFYLRFPDSPLKILNIEHTDNFFYVDYLCKECNKNYRGRSYNLLYGFGCPTCSITKAAQSRTRTQEEFILELFDIFKDDIEVLEEYANCKIPINFKCKKHDLIFKQTPDCLLNTKINKCPECARKRQLEKIFNDTLTKEEIQTRLDFKFDNSIRILSKLSRIKAKEFFNLECLQCGFIWNSTPDISYRSKGCPKCNALSLYEVKVTNILSYLNIDYIMQHSYEDCKADRKLRFDFYLPEYDTIIEADGNQHFKPISVFGGDISFEKQKIYDKIKDDYCEIHNINLLRVSDLKLRTYKHYTFKELFDKLNILVWNIPF